MLCAGPWLCSCSKTRPASTPVCTDCSDSIKQKLLEMPEHVGNLPCMCRNGLQKPIIRQGQNCSSCDNPAGSILYQWFCQLLYLARWVAGGRHEDTDGEIGEKATRIAWDALNGTGTDAADMHPLAALPLQDTIAILSYIIGQNNFRMRLYGGHCPDFSISRLERRVADLRITSTLVTSRCPVWYAPLMILMRSASLSMRQDPLMIMAWLDLLAVAPVGEHRTALDAVHDGVHRWGRLSPGHLASIVSDMRSKRVGADVAADGVELQSRLHAIIDRHGLHHKVDAQGQLDIAPNPARTTLPPQPTPSKEKVKERGPCRQPLTLEAAQKELDELSKGVPANAEEARTRKNRRLKLKEKIKRVKAKLATGELNNANGDDSEINEIGKSFSKINVGSDAAADGEPMEECAEGASNPPVSTCPAAATVEANDQGRTVRCAPPPHSTMASPRPTTSEKQVWKKGG